MPEKRGQHFLRDESVLLFIYNTISSLFSFYKSGEYYPNDSRSFCIDDIYGTCMLGGQHMSMCQQRNGMQGLKIEDIVVIEVGPGRGALTNYIKDITKSFFVIEKDLSFQKHLFRILGKKNIFWGDVLDINMNHIAQKYNQLFVSGKKQGSFLGTTKNVGVLITGNLPYYITSPILRKFFSLHKGMGLSEDGVLHIQNLGDNKKVGRKKEKQGYVFKILGGVFLVQKEFAEKIVTCAKKKSYIWRLINAFYDVRYVLSVPSSSFFPEPKVQSALIVLLPHYSFPLHDEFAYNYMKKFLHIVSPYKRKTLGKIAKMQKDLLRSIDVCISQDLCPKRLEELGRNEMKSVLGII